MNLNSALGSDCTQWVWIGPRVTLNHARKGASCLKRVVIMWPSGFGRWTWCNPSRIATTREHVTVCLKLCWQGWEKYVYKLGSCHHCIGPMPSCYMVPMVNNLVIALCRFIGYSSKQLHKGSAMNPNRLSFIWHHDRTHVNLYPYPLYAYGLSAIRRSLLLPMKLNEHVQSNSLIQCQWLYTCNEAPHVHCLVGVCVFAWTDVHICGQCIQCAFYHDDAAWVQ